jgi:thermostable 8-oxoguanine DNA glycosylase
MIDPNNIINYNRSDAQLEELILFLVAVAGKKASTVAPNLDRFLYKLGTDLIVNYSPFEILRYKFFPHGDLHARLKNHGFGCQNRLNRAFKELAYSDINLRTCTKEDLTKIHGIGRKSASCFLAWTRKGENVAMLDTHLLKWVRQCQLGFSIMPKNHPLKYMEAYIKDVPIPKSTPSSKRLYDKIETFYLVYCQKMGLDPTEYDLQIWRQYSNKNPSL